MNMAAVALLKACEDLSAVECSPTMSVAINVQRVALNIFDVRSGKVLRDFKGSADDFATGGTGGVAGVSWPVFRQVSFASSKPKSSVAPA